MHRFTKGLFEVRDGARAESEGLVRRHALGTTVRRHRSFVGRRRRGQGLRGLGGLGGSLAWDRSSAAAASAAATSTGTGWGGGAGHSPCHGRLCLGFRGRGDQGRGLGRGRGHQQHPSRRPRQARPEQSPPNGRAVGHGDALRRQGRSRLGRDVTVVGLGLSE